MASPKYYIWTVGCQMNVADSAKLAAGLERLGWSETDGPESAQLVVLNTCSIRERSEQKAISELGRLKKLLDKRMRLAGSGPEFKIVVMGCMVGPRQDELKRRFPFVDHFARPQAYDGIFEAVGIAEDTGGEFWPTTFAAATGPTAYVPVIHGCDKFCTYCIVPYRRGRERSRTVEDVRLEVEHLVARGAKEVTLLGQTVEAYGHDLEERRDLGDLMYAIHDIEGLERIRFLTSYPKDMTAKIIEAVRDLPKVCEYFNIPVQSGSDTVLERMRRGYTVGEYREKVDLIRRYMPEAAITTDVIVGFCGETDAEFRATYDLLADLRFDKVHVAAYSPRPRTIAYRKLEDDVPDEVKRQRLHAVEELEREISASINRRYEGREEDVLVEGRRDSLWYGRTRSNKLLHFAGEAAVGDIVRVRVERSSAWSLQGTAVSEALPLLV
ncbi:MAG TPA: tRNA (N6-isopentenyl adenosine(37)-C2)-methylthiotransferase MiaB [Dehalococcoidia bacterium]|nr:tRNA (N6-isopentenyl adenosine(37)-C2)-methylthiotransferase MiaB [Dehalococcoidia bacterium]